MVNGISRLKNANGLASQGLGNNSFSQGGLVQSMLGIYSLNTLASLDEVNAANEGRRQMQIEQSINVGQDKFVLNLPPWHDNVPTDLTPIRIPSTIGDAIKDSTVRINGINSHTLEPYYRGYNKPIKKTMSLREELQSKTDKWLDSVNEHIKRS